MCIYNFTRGNAYLRSTYALPAYICFKWLIFEGYLPDVYEINNRVSDFYLSLLMRLHTAQQMKIVRISLKLW